MHLLLPVILAGWVLFAGASSQAVEAKAAEMKAKTVRMTGRTKSLKGYLASPHMTLDELGHAYDRRAACAVGARGERT